MADPQSEPLEPTGPLPGDHQPDIDSMIRVDQAGEYGATRIYAGQLAILGDRSPAARSIARMAEQERRHCERFDALTIERGSGLTEDELQLWKRRIEDGILESTEEIPQPTEEEVEPLEPLVGLDHIDTGSDMSDMIPDSIPITDADEEPDFSDPGMFQAAEEPSDGFDIPDFEVPDAPAEVPVIVDAGVGTASDAAYAIFNRPSAECTGNFFIDDDVLKAEGVTDLDHYAVPPGADLLPDFFV